MPPLIVILPIGSVVSKISKDYILAEPFISSSADGVDVLIPTRLFVTSK